METIIKDRGDFIKDQVNIDLRDKDIVTGQIAVSNLCRAEVHAKNHNHIIKDFSTDCEKINFQSNLSQKNMMFEKTQKRLDMPFDSDTLSVIEKMILYFFTFKNLSTFRTSIISNMCEFIKMNANEHATAKLAIFVIPNISTLDDIEKVIQFECAHILNDHSKNKKYNEPSGFDNSMIRYINLDLKKTLNLPEIIVSIIKKYYSSSHIMHFFLTSFNKIEKLEYFHYLYENFFYKKTNNLNFTRLFILTDLPYSRFRTYLNRMDYAQKRLFGKKNITYNFHKYDLSKIEEFQYLMYQIFLENFAVLHYLNIYYIKKVIKNIYNNAQHIEMHLRNHEFKYITHTKSVCDIELDFIEYITNYFVRPKNFITIFRHTFYRGSPKKYTNHLLYRIENKNKVHFVNYYNIDRTLDRDNNFIQSTFYNKIDDDPYVIEYKTIRNKTSQSEAQAFLEEYKNEPECFLYNLLTNIIDQPSTFCFELQNMYESYLFDTFAFKITAVKHFSYTIDINNTNFIKNLVNTYKNALIKRFSKFNIKQCECNFMIGSRRFIKRLYTSIEVESKSMSKKSKCNFELINSQSSMLNFIKKHCIKFTIKESNTKQASYLYNSCKIIQFIIKDHCREDIFFMFLLEDSNLFYNFEKKFDILKRNDKKLKEFFNNIGESLESKDKSVIFKYRLDEIEYKISMNLFTFIEKNELIYDLWNEFVKFTNFDLIYIIINKQFKEFVLQCFKKYKFDHLVKNESVGEESIKVSGTFEGLVDRLTTIFELFGEKLLSNIYESNLDAKKNDMQVLFMSQNLFDYNFATYLNIYNDQVNIKYNGIIENCVDCCNNSRNY